MRFEFSIVPGAGVGPPFVQESTPSQRVRVDAGDNDLLVDVWTRAADALGFGVGYGLDQSAGSTTAFLRFVAPDDVGHDTRRHLNAKDLEIVGSDGHVVFARSLENITVEDLLRTADAGLIPGDVSRPYFIPQTPQGASEWFVSWPVLVGAYVMVRGILNAMADLEGTVALLQRIRGGTTALVDSAPRLEMRGARPDALYDLLGRRPWAAADLASRLDCADETAVDLLRLFGFEADRTGLWRAGASDDAVLLRALLDEIITTAAEGAGAHGGSFEDRVRHLVTHRSRKALPYEMKEYEPLEPGQAQVVDRHEEDDLLTSDLIDDDTEFGDFDDTCDQGCNAQGDSGEPVRDCAVVWGAQQPELDGDMLRIEFAVGLGQRDLDAAAPPAGVSISVADVSVGKGASGTGVGLVLEIAEHVLNDVAGLIGIGLFLREIISKVNARRESEPANATPLALAALGAAETPAIRDAPACWQYARTVPLTTDGSVGTDMRDVWASSFVDESTGVVQLVFSSSTTRHLGVALVPQEWWFDGANGRIRSDAELAEVLRVDFLS